MVGVPGRSKGCSTCRSRKKGQQCGKQRPSCIQCIQAGLTCGGYERERIWVNDTPQKSWTGSTTYTPSKAASSGPSRHHYLGETNAITLYDGFSRTARQELYFGQYWDVYQPSTNGYAPSTATPFSTAGWVGVPSDLYDKEPALKYALVALSASALSVHENDQDLRVKGLQAYSFAIKEVTQAFKQPSRIAGDGLLGAIRLMIFFEIVFGAVSDTAEQPGWSGQINGWHGHICGEQSILRFRGPESFVSGSAHQLFTDGRLQLLSLAISERRRTILSEPAWKTIPWRQAEKTARDLALDILADVPGLMEDLDTLQACTNPEKARELRVKLQADCDRARADLKLWKIAYGADLAKYDYTTATGSLPTPETVEDLEILRLCHTYWMTCALVYSTSQFASEVRDVTDPIAATHEQDMLSESKAADITEPSSRNPGDLRETIICAYKIARAIHLFTKPEYRLASFHAALIPLGIALRILVLTEPRDAPSEERMMLVNYFRQPYMGSYAGKFMRNIQLFLRDKDMADK